jgi:hypothetical protein
VYIPTRPRTGRAPAVKILFIINVPSPSPSEETPAQFQPHCPRHERRLPARFHTGDFAPTYTPLALSRTQPLAFDHERVSQPPPIDEEGPSQNNDTNITNNNSDRKNDNIIGDDSNININTIIPEENVHTVDALQIFDDVTNTSDCRHLIPAQFSTSEKAAKAEEDIERIRRYLLSRRAPPDLLGDALTRFISRTRRFVISNGRLWR